MKNITIEECKEISGGVITASGGTAALSGILGAAAWAVGEAGLESLAVPVIGTALGGFLGAGAAVMGAAAGVAYLAGD